MCFCALFLAPWVLEGAETGPRITGLRPQRQVTGARYISTTLQDDAPLHSHLIETDGQGNLVGHLSRMSADSEATVGLSGLKVFVVRNSRVVSEAVSDGEGKFTLPDVPPGSYAICAAGNNGFLAYGIQVAEPSRVSAVGERVAVPVALNVLWQEEPEFQIDAAVVPPAFQALRRIMSRYMPDLADELMSSSDGDDDYELNVDNRSVASDLRVTLNSDGTLVGRMAPLTRRRDKPARLREMNAFLIQDDEIYARVPVNEDGIFRFVDVEPGVYSFAAAGEEGFAAISFRAVEQPPEDSAIAGMNSGAPGFQWVSTSVPAVTGSLNIALAPASEVPFLMDQMEAVFQAGQGNSSNAGGGAASGGAGGGGAGGSGGLGGGLGAGALSASGLLGGLGGTAGLSDPFGSALPGDGFIDDGSFVDGPGDLPGDGSGDHPPIPEPATVMIWVGIAVTGFAFWWLRRSRRGFQRPR